MNQIRGGGERYRKTPDPRILQPTDLAPPLFMANNIHRQYAITAASELINKNMKHAFHEEERIGDEISLIVSKNESNCIAKNAKLQSSFIGGGYRNYPTYIGCLQTQPTMKNDVFNPCKRIRTPHNLFRTINDSCSLQ